MASLNFTKTVRFRLRSVSLTNKTTQNWQLTGLISFLLLWRPPIHTTVRRKGKKDGPLQTESIGSTLDRLPDYSSSTETMSDSQTIFTLLENLEFKVMKHLGVSCYLISLYPTYKSVSLFKFPSYSHLYTLINKHFSFWVPLPAGEHGLSPASQQSWPLKRRMLLYLGHNYSLFHIAMKPWCWIPTCQVPVNSTPRNSLLPSIKFTL